MAKYEEPFVETNELFDEKLEFYGLSKLIVATVVTDNTAKKIYKITKASPLLKYRTGDDVLIVLNEKIFDRLTPEQRSIVVDEAISGLSYNNDKEAVEVTPTDVNTYKGVLTKYGFDTWNVLDESIKSLYAAEKEEADKQKSLKTKTK